jgi:hypothetical protein
MRRRPWAVALVAWTLFVWTTRIANIWRDPDLDTGEQVGRTALAGSFTLLAVLVVVAVWRGPARARSWSVTALAGWSTAVWVVRDARIVVADHEVGFKVVHTVLAVVSIALSALAWRESRRVDRVGDDADRIGHDADRAVEAGGAASRVDAQAPTS